MPRGHYSTKYLSDANAQHATSAEKFFAEVDAYTGEIFTDEKTYFAKIDFVVILPPLGYEGQFVKGIAYTQAADLLVERFPWIKELFHLVANSLWGSIPWSRQADGLFSLYENPQREEAFYKSLRPQVLIPLQDADHLNEYLLAPTPGAEKVYDAVCVSQALPYKNLPMVAAALKVFREKYRPIRMALAFGTVTTKQREIWQQVESILGDTSCLKVFPRVAYGLKLAELYSQSRVCVLGSLFEGKVRVLQEAISCNTPVVHFKDFNSVIRGGSPVVPDGAGLAAADFDAECFADTLHEALDNEGEFRPRRRYLETNGRMSFLETCVGAFGRELDPLWLDLAVQQNYGIGLYDFIYGRKPTISHVRSLPAIEQTVCYFRDRFLRT